MHLKNRVAKLERSQPNDMDLPIVLHRVFGAKDGKPDGEPRIEFARIPGINAGLLEIRDDETEAEFLRRVYATKIANKPLTEMTDDELETVMAATDEEIALGQWRTRSPSG
ncbi:hypothetical protein [Shimia aestuarii]|uniref:hypothetical protein n=1 Tax=Shimia aestuarii TaxID=254406 RepID=UPI001FB3B656|nr:hypothetical protein [Shimia aestuarii]